MINQALTVSHVKDAEVSVIPKAIAFRDHLVEVALEIKVISDKETQAKAVSAVRDLKAACKGVEENRKELKKPLLDLGRDVDSLAKEFVATMQTEVRRLEAQIGAFQAEEERRRAEAKRKAEEEAARLEAEKRRIEAERIAKEREAEAQRAREEAERQEKANAARQAAEDDLFRLMEDDHSGETPEPVKTAAETPPETGRAEVIEEEARQLREQESEIEAKRLRSVIALPAKPEKVDGLTVGAPWKFKVVDLAALYAARPELCKLDAKTAAINAVIRNGEREIAGLTIYQETKAVVRT